MKSSIFIDIILSRMSYIDSSEENEIEGSDDC